MKVVRFSNTAFLPGKGPSRRRTIRAAAAVTLAISIAAGVTGCGGGSSSAGAEGKDPAAVPLYSRAYASLGAEGSNLSSNIHQTFVLGQQHGADFFDAEGKPTFTSDGAVAAVKQYIDFMAKDKIIAPGNAEYAQNQALTDFAKGKTAMVLWQAAASTFASPGMKPEDWGAAPVPVPSGTPGQDKNTNSMVAGINMAVFKNTKNIDGAKKFVKFMTSDAEQKLLNKTYGSIGGDSGDVACDHYHRVPIRRTQYLEEHLAACARAVRKGAPAGATRS